MKLLLSLLILLNFGCSNYSNNSVYAIAASPTECSNGGTDMFINGNEVSTVCNGTNGAVGPRGSQGAQGTPGLMGPMGPAGPIGIPGVNGLNGTNGTQVIPIKFCPGKTVYPNTFLEYGLLINGNIYGVYSLNGGFWAYLPPGTYTSDGVGSSCNFTINADESITDN